MNQYRCPHSGSHVRRARREITELGVVRERDPSTELAVNSIQGCERGAKLEPRLKRLQAEVILLVDHDAQSVRQIHRGARAQWVLRLEARQLLAHEVALEQQRAVRRTQLVDANEQAIVQSWQHLQRFAHLDQYPQALAVARPARERIAVDVSSE